jgi:surface antigen
MLVLFMFISMIQVQVCGGTNLKKLIVEFRSWIRTGAVITALILLPLSGVIQVNALFGDDYPWKNAFAYDADNYDWRVDENGDGDYLDSGEDLSSYNYNYRNCTDFIAWRIDQVFGINVSGWGHAYQWSGSASSAGYLVDNTPKIGDIAQWGASTGGGFGHVAYVYDIVDGIPQLEEYNHLGNGQYTSNYPRTAELYIHVSTDDIGSSDSVKVITGDSSDFNGDGKDDLGLRRGSKFFLDYERDGITNKVYTWGEATDTLLIGDFNGDGKDDLGLRRGSKFFLDYERDGITNKVYTWGEATDTLLCRTSVK